MVAFVGAVICIIAAVHTGSGSAATAPQQPAADNHSLSPDHGAQSPARGSVARAVPLGALHGSETPGSEVPTLNIGLDGTGVGGRPDSAVSRLICTPIPAGECNPRKFQQQADDPGKDWGHLHTAAEELRQTVLQQKDQILTDQRTIRELTGKLSECESEIDGRSSQERSAGLWGGRGGEEGHLMVRDSPLPSTAAKLLTARAVDKLEQAIIQLKSRIERLESDIGPSPHNRTDGSATGPGGLSDGNGGLSEAGQERWRVEDLEGELERKVEQLEKERKAMRLQTHRHWQDIDRGIDTLHHRMAELEEGLSEYPHPGGFRLSFPTRTNYMYAVVDWPVPELGAFTVCMWLLPSEGGIGTPLSYAVPDQPNELVLLQGLHTPVELLVNDKVAQLPLNLTRGSWQHLCVSWSQKDGAWHAYQGGKLRGRGQGLAARHHVRPGGVLILGQEQDILGGRFDSSQALVGELSQVSLWERALPAAEVARLARCGRVTQGNVAPWSDRNLALFGGATKEAGEPCAKHTRLGGGGEQRERG